MIRRERVVHAQIALACLLPLLGTSSLCGAGSNPSSAASAQAAGPGRGFPLNGPWVSYYGQAPGIDLGRVAATFRIINIDADPSRANFTPAQIEGLKAGGRNRVISYFNLGSVERSRQYWKRAPKGFVPAKKNHKAQLGPYEGYPDEVWMDPGNRDWRKLLVDHVAPRLVAQGIDGFYFDNLEIVEHEASSDKPVCNKRCRQGGLDLVRELRVTYPSLLFVMQNATSDITRLGRTGGAAFAELIDGVTHEDTFTSFSPSSTGNAEDVTYELRTDRVAVEELAHWQGMRLRPGGQPFWIGTEDYVNSCDNVEGARAVYAQARWRGFSPYVSDKSALQNTVCYWSF